jgi:predicted Zn-dependent protease
MNDSAPKTKGLVWLIAACALGAVFAVGLSPLAHVIPWSWEKKLSYALDLNIPKEECRNNPQAQELMQRLVKRIYPVNSDAAAFSIDVQIVKNPAVNAYATLGGRISVNSGLLKQAESPEEIAGVLAHEIGHVQHRHIMEGAIAHMLTSEGISMIFGGYSSAAEWTQYFLNMDFTRSQEAQADEEGLIRLQQAHVDNQAFRHFFERMEKSGSVPVFLSDHPSNNSRSGMAAKFDNRGATPVLAPEEWQILKNYCNE